MQIKKNIRSFTIIFNLNGSRNKIEKYDVLEDLFLSFEDVIIVNKNIKPQELMKINQSGKKTLMIDGDIQPFDEIKILLKLVNNFFIHTNQIQYFSLEFIEKELDEETLIVYGSEIYLGDLNKINFTPTIRSRWRNPQIINNLIEMN